MSVVPFDSTVVGSGTEAQHHFLRNFPSGKVASFTLDGIRKSDKRCTFRGYCSENDPSILGSDS